MSWSTDFSKLPKEGRVIVQPPEPLTDACLVTEDVKLLREHDGIGYVAWHPEPEPYKPPKPEQITADSALWNLYRKEIVAAVEKRTREIVEWEQTYGAVK